MIRADWPIWETDAGLDELYAALAAAEIRRDAADALADMTDGDYEAEFRAADEAMYAIQGRIDELEGVSASAELRELISCHRWASL